MVYIPLSHSVSSKPKPNNKGLDFEISIAIAFAVFAGIFGIARLFFLCCNRPPSPDAWKYRNDYDSVRRRVREGYGSERQQKRDKAYMAKKNWSVDVELGAGAGTAAARGRVPSMPKPPAPTARTAGRSYPTFESVAASRARADFIPSAREPRPYSLPTPGMTRSTANVPGRIPTSTPLNTSTSGGAERTNWTGMPTSPVRAPVPPLRRGPLSEPAPPIPPRRSSIAPTRARTDGGGEAAPAYDALREEAERARLSARAGGITLPPPAYTANPRDGEVVAEGRGEDDDRLGGAREEGHREGIDREGRRGVWVTTFHAEN